MNNALKNSINVILKAALNEDKIHSDITTLSLVDSRVISCEIKFKEKAVLCGTKIVTHIAKNFNKKKIFSQERLYNGKITQQLLNNFHIFVFL